MFQIAERRMEKRAVMAAVVALVVLISTPATPNEWQPTTPFASLPGLSTNQVRRSIRFIFFFCYVIIAGAEGLRFAPCSYWLLCFVLFLCFVRSDWL